MVPRLCITKVGNKHVVSVEAEFDRFDEAHAFDIDLIELVVKHLRLTTPPYEYETPWC